VLDTHDVSDLARTRRSPRAAPWTSARTLRQARIARHRTQSGVVVGHHELTLHADRGASMKSKLVAQLLVDLSVIKSHNRPHTSNDNPYSESQFKTLKYRPTFPRRFTNIDAANQHCRRFFDWYNVEHKHSGIAMLTPAIVHHGLANEALAARQVVLDQAFATHPERFKHTAPQIRSVPEAVWINSPKLKDDDQQLLIN
jgi:putative transposase